MNFSKEGQQAMNARMRVRPIHFAIVVMALVLSPVARAQDDSGESKGIDSGDYNIHQSIEFGYRANEINGNKDTYDTFENLGSGLRLFDYSLQMRSLDHKGFLFDSLRFSNFGYGGDPNDVTRLRIGKNKLYDFRVLFRRDKNFWDYNLLANPLNPASLNPPGSLTTGCYVGPPTGAFPQGAPAYCSSPSVAINNSPHAQDLVRRMQDYDLTLLPNSAVQVRLGYSRNRDEGPGFFTTDGGTISDFNDNYSYTTNAYRIGFDFKILPRTTISYDQFLSYFSQNNVVSDNPVANPQNFGFILANPSGVGTTNGTPVDLGNIWTTQTPSEPLPCMAPIVTGTINTANPNCNGFLSYSQVGSPRNFMPTERLRFQSNYFNNFEMSGSVGYSTSSNQIPNFLETVDGWTARTAERGSTTSGPADARRVSVNADWSGVYAVTDKLRILDSFRYDNWRIPGMWALDETNIFGTGFPGVSGLLQDPGQISAAFAGWRNFGIAILALAVAFIIALFSAAAAQEGRIWVAGITTLISLGIAAWVAIAIVPALARRTSLRWIAYQIDYKLTRDGVIYLGAVFVLVLAAVNTGNNLLFLILACLLAGILISGVLSRIVLTGIELKFDLPEHIFAEQPVLAEVELRNDKQMWPSFSLRVIGGKKKSPAEILARPVFFPYIPRMSATRQKVELRFPRRGVYRQDSFGIRTRFPFGFFEKTRHVDSNLEIAVYPRVEP